MCSVNQPFGQRKMAVYWVGYASVRTEAVCGSVVVFRSLPGQARSDPAGCSLLTLAGRVVEVGGGHLRARAERHLQVQLAHPLGVAQLGVVRNIRLQQQQQQQGESRDALELACVCMGVGGPQCHAGCHQHALHNVPVPHACMHGHASRPAGGGCRGAMACVQMQAAWCTEAAVALLPAQPQCMCVVHATYHCPPSPVPRPLALLSSPPCCGPL